MDRQSRRQVVGICGVGLFVMIGVASGLDQWGSSGPSRADCDRWIRQEANLASIEDDAYINGTRVRWDRARYDRAQTVLLAPAGCFPASRIEAERLVARSLSWLVEPNYGLSLPPSESSGGLQ